MKKSILFLLGVASTATFACPDLRGNYTCSGPGGGGTLEISQSGNSFSVSLPTSSKGPLEVVANGQLKEANLASFTFSTVASCSRDGMRVASKIVNGQKGNENTLESIFTFTKVGADKIKLDVQSNFIKGQLATNSTIPSECVRK
jgi:hypothetical protein